MKSRYSDGNQVEWKMGDIRNMPEIDTVSIDVAFDKGAMDAMIHGSHLDPPDDVMDNTRKYIDEVGHRIVYSFSFICVITSTVS